MGMNYHCKPKVYVICERMGIANKVKQFRIISFAKMTVLLLANSEGHCQDTAEILEGSSETVRYLVLECLCWHYPFQIAISGWNIACAPVIRSI